MDDERVNPRRAQMFVECEARGVRVATVPRQLPAPALLAQRGKAAHERPPHAFAAVRFLDEQVFEVQVALPVPSGERAEEDGAPHHAVRRVLGHERPARAFVEHAAREVFRRGRDVLHPIHRGREAAGQPQKIGRVVARGETIGDDGIHACLLLSHTCKVFGLLEYHTRAGQTIARLRA